MLKSPSFYLTMAPTCKTVKVAIRIRKEKPDSASVKRKGEYAQEKNSIYRVWYHLLFLASSRGVGAYSPEDKRERVFVSGDPAWALPGTQTSDLQACTYK